MNPYQELEQIFIKLSHLNHLQAFSSWDEAVMMPTGGGEARAKALATLQSLSHEILTQPKVGELINAAKDENLEDPWQQANLKWIERKYTNATCLPTELVKKVTEATIACEQAWRKLRAENNWQEFQPLLERSVNLIKESAKIRGDRLGKSVYDVLVDEFSPGMSQAIIDPIFEDLKNELPTLIQTVIDKQKSQPIITLKNHYPTDKQRQLGLELMQALGFDFNHGRLDVSHHPFCSGVPQDVRITTRYERDEFLASAMAICHETGHARYEQGLPKKWLDQPVGHALGIHIHESQSLLIERQACHTPEFMQFLSPLVKNQFGDDPSFGADNLFKIATRVKPDYIRVYADELTYPLHVILRYELEQKLFRDEIEVSDLPEAWDQKMQEYLNLSTKGNDKDGAMQDVHWPCGIFGYFPSYTLGALIAAQLFNAAKQAHPQILTELSHGNFTTLFAWLNKNVHGRGSSVNTEQLLMDATSEPLNPDYLLKHLKKRYL